MENGNISIVEAINALKIEREQHAAAIVAINKQLAEIAGVLPRRRREKSDEPVKVKTGRKAKVNATPPAEA